MKLARAIHFDESDQRIFHSPARTGEWCVAGGFEFSNFTQSDLTGKAKQAFSNGWLGVETFGRVTFVAVTDMTDAERDGIIDALCAHFVSHYGAPDAGAARPVAEDELSHMMELCADHPTNTLLTVSRELSENGVRETFRVIEAQEAGIEQFAIHGSLDEPPHKH